MTTIAGARHAGRAPRSQLLARLVTGAVIAVVFLLPVLYVLMIAFETDSHYAASPMVPPPSLHLQNFSAAWTQGDIGRQLVNTVLYAVVASAVATALALLIAYPLARRLVRGHNLVYGLVAVGLFLPFSIIPLFIEARSLNLFNNTPGYIILHIEPGMPLGVVLLTAFITAVPGELDEAAWVDGVSYLKYLSRVIVPLTRPALLITFLYGMLGCGTTSSGRWRCSARPATTSSRSRVASTTSIAATRTTIRSSRRRSFSPACRSSRCSPEPSAS